MTSTHIAARQTVAATTSEFLRHPSRYTGLRGVPDFVARRLPGWATHGADVDTVVDTIRDAGLRPTTTAWVTAFTSLGDQHLETADSADRATDREAAAAAFFAASFCYFLARWPSPARGRTDAWEAYTRHRAAYLAACERAGHHLDVLLLPFGDAQLVAYLHRVPDQAATSPLVIVCGGIDVWKSDPGVHAIARSLVSRGLNVLTVDIPGTGQSPIRPAPGATGMFTTLIDHLLTRPDTHAARLGILGLSFGGHWATAVGLSDDRIQALVNIAGPLHHAFQPDWLAQLPPATLASLANSLALAECHPDRMINALGRMSLLAQGLLDRPHRPAILAINGALDEQVPITDLTLLTDHGLTQDTLTFGDDRHCASYNTALHLPFAAAWLAAHLAD